MTQLAQNPKRSEYINEIARLISHITGVELGDKQTAMLETRLQKRIRDLGFQSPSEYLDFIKSNVEKESAHLVSLLTTHHTFFFREFSHFEYIEKELLPRLIPELRAAGRKTIKIWSAACSQGQEVYSLAMFMHHHLKTMAPDFNFEIIGSDVDPASVNTAKNGVYRWDDLKEIPLVYLWSHWARGTGDIRDFAKAKSTLKAHCKFHVQNLNQTPDPKLGQVFDIIFCRNVFIYFTPKQIAAISAQLLKYLSPEGILVVGTSESLRNLNLPLSSPAPAIYTKAKPAATKPVVTQSPSGVAKVIPIARPSATAAPAAAAAPAKKPRVLCVDDSPTVLTLLKKILSDEFEIVDVAMNGLEAKEKLTKIKVDVMTLDIHMPGQGGIEYLEKNFGPNHPPVVIISSVPREDSQTAFQCLQLGASDYIEKPKLTELTTRTNEIQTKLRVAARQGRPKEISISTVDRSFSKTFEIKDADRKLRAVFTGVSERMKLAKFLTELPAPQPPTIVFVEGSTGILPSIAEMLKSKTGKTVEVLSGPEAKLEPGIVYLADLTQSFDGIKRLYAGRPTSIVVFGDIAQASASRVMGWEGAEIILEDMEMVLSKSHQELMRKAKYFVPYTSMAYHSNEFLSGNSASKK